MPTLRSSAPAPTHPRLDIRQFWFGYRSPSIRVAVWASDNPFKSHQTPLVHRMAMLQLLIEAINPPRHNLQLYPELSKPRTIHTLEVAETLWPEATFTLVIGSDLIYQLPNWYQSDVLLERVKLLIIPRPGFVPNEMALAELRLRGARLTICRFDGSRYILHRVS